MDKNSSVIEVCQELVRKRSYSGEEKEVVSLIVDIMTAYGFDEIKTDRYGNVYGIYQGEAEGPTQLYDAHIDTVVVADESKWTQDPFGGELVDGKIYGRGTSDMKGALAAMLVGARDFVEARGRAFQGKICVAGVVHEECFEGVAARELSKAIQPDYVVIGEASALKLKHGQRGRAEVVIETFGKPAHSANPGHGINAVYQMSEVIGHIKDMEVTSDPDLGQGILVLTDIISSPFPGASVVPDYCRTTWDRRLLVGETRESVMAPIEACIRCLAEDNEELKAKASYAMESIECYTGETIGDVRFFPAWYYQPEEAFVRKTFEALQDHQLADGLACYDFCTNGSHYAGEAGIKTLGFGPSEEFLAHTIDEYIEVSQLEAAVKGYQVIMETLASL